MRKDVLEKLTDEQLVDAFAEWAREQRLAMMRGGGRATNRAFWKRSAVADTLRARGRSVREKLPALLDHADEGVRYFAAHQSLAIAPERARAVIEDVHKRGIPSIALAAGMTLSNLDSGLFKPT